MDLRETRFVRFTISFLMSVFNCATGFKVYVPKMSKICVAVIDTVKEMCTFYSLLNKDQFKNRNFSYRFRNLSPAPHQRNCSALCFVATFSLVDTLVYLLKKFTLVTKINSIDELLWVAGANLTTTCKARIVIKYP